MASPTKVANTKNTTNDGTAREHVENAAHEVRLGAEKVVEEAVEGATALYESGRESVIEHTEALAKSVKKEPLKSVAVAAGIGFFVGLLINRR